MIKSCSGKDVSPWLVDFDGPSGSGKALIPIRGDGKRKILRTHTAPPAADFLSYTFHHNTLRVSLKGNEPFRFHSANPLP